MIQLLKKHPFALAVFVLYTLLCCLQLKMEFRVQDNLRQSPGLSGIEAGGEDPGMGAFLLVFIGCVISLVNACWIVARPKTYKFYAVFFLVMTFEMFAVFYIGSKL